MTFDKPSGQKKKEYKKLSPELLLSGNETWTQLVYFSWPRRRRPVVTVKVCVRGGGGGVKG